MKKFLNEFSRRFILILFLFFSLKTNSQTWINTWYNYINYSTMVRDDYFDVGPKEICLNKKNQVVSIVQVDQERRNEIIYFKNNINLTPTINLASDPGGIYNEDSYSLHATEDSGYVYLYMHDDYNGHRNYKFYKKGNSGSWTNDINNYSDPYMPHILEVVPTKYNTFYVVFSDSLVELDNSGNFIRQSSPFSGGSVSCLNDSDLIVCTSTIRRQDFNGNIRWIFPLTDFKSFYKDSSFIYAERGDFVLKINSTNGSLIWSKNILHTGISKTSDNGFVTTYGSILSKYDSTGNLVLSRSVPYPLYGYKQIVEYLPGKYLTGGAIKNMDYPNIGSDYAKIYFIATFDSTFQGIIDSTDNFISGNANDDDYLSFANDAPAVAAAIGDSGLKRIPIYNQNWTGPFSVFATNWEGRFTSGLNHKYSDINGDGKIDTTDINLLMSYPSRQVFPHWLKTSSPLDLPEIKIFYEEDTIYSGDSVTVDVVFGSITKPIDSIYSFAVRIIDHQFLYNGSKAYIQSSKFNDSLSNFFSYFISRTNSSNLVMSRQDYKNVMVDGDTIVKFRIKTGDGLSGRYFLESEYSAIVKEGNSIPLLNNVRYGNLNDTIFILNTTYIETIQKQEFKIFPNPSSEGVTISSDFDNIDRLIIIDHTGKKIVTNNDVGKELQFNVAKFPAGIYSILCYVDDKILLSKFVVEH